LDLGNGGEYYGSCKQVLSQSNVSTSDFKSTSTKVQAQNHQQTTLLMTLAKEIQAKEKSGLLKIMVLGKISQQIRPISKTFQ
jgi:hypothetical protein